MPSCSMCPQASLGPVQVALKLGEKGTGYLDYYRLCDKDRAHGTA